MILFPTVCLILSSAHLGVKMCLLMVLEGPHQIIINRDIRTLCQEGLFDEYFAVTASKFSFKCQQF